jgi:DNA-binding response OmpR family regulator
MNNNVILFADDDRDLQQAVGLTLEGAGFQVIFADNGLQALELWRTNPVDAIISDIVMPSLSGLNLCKFIRHSSQVPIILLTGKRNEEDIVIGFEVGADDYVVKPFRPRELVVRLQALLRRTNGRSSLAYRNLAFGQLTLDLEAQRVLYHEKSIPVSPLEFRLLKYLMQNAGVVLTKEDLLRNVWGYRSTGTDMNMIEATVRRLRKKVESDPAQPRYIQTVWGTGYRFGD